MDEHEARTSYLKTSPPSIDGDLLRFNGYEYGYLLFPPGARFEWQGRIWVITDRSPVSEGFYFRAEAVE
jgi:hypothetical protein